MARFTLEINGRQQIVDADPQMPLLWVLRDLLNLTGTKYGCGIGLCGACTILVDGAAVRSCLMLAVQAADKAVVTIEGLADGEALSPLQQSFRRNHGLQCGFCTPGFLMTAHALLTQEPHADEERIRDVLSGNVCRCTGYLSIVKAILDARSAYQ